MFQIQVGDQVGYGRYHNGTLIQHGFSKVVKINHHGHIHLENGKVFDKHGDERGSTYGVLRLIPAERLREQLDHIQAQRARNQRMMELKNLLDSQRNGRGEMCEISADTRARMIELVSQL
jgi:hypothetical protein